MYQKHELEVIEYERNVYVVASENLNGGTDIGEQPVLPDDDE